MTRIAILTNARAADQRSMIGYGELLLESARCAGYDVSEFRGASFLSRLAPGRVGGRPMAKLMANLDRFVATPLALMGRRADIVHVVDPGNVLYLDVLRHRASVVTLHDVIPYLCAAGRLEGFRPTTTGRRLMAAILRRLQRVDRIVCVSESTRRDLLALVELDPGRVVTIPNTVFQSMGPATPEACTTLRQRLRLPADAPIILHVGSNSFYKNRPTVLEIFARVAPLHPRAVLLFVGPRAADLVDRASALGLVERVHFVERIDRDDIAAVYSTASVLLFPSLYEGFGYPVLEAQLCGTPVICSNSGPLPEVAGDAALIRDPKDVTGMSQAVESILRGEKVSLIAAGYRNAKRFALKSWREEHDRLYRSVLPPDSAAKLIEERETT